MNGDIEESTDKKEGIINLSIQGIKRGSTSRVSIDKVILRCAFCMQDIFVVVANELSLPALLVQRVVDNLEGWVG